MARFDCHSEKDHFQFEVRHTRDNNDYLLTDQLRFSSNGAFIRTASTRLAVENTRIHACHILGKRHREHHSNVSGETALNSVSRTGDVVQILDVELITLINCVHSDHLPSEVRVLIV